MASSSFPIPASLQDLEHEPYNLFPYPSSFDEILDSGDDDSAARRADLFSDLVAQLEQGNLELLNGLQSAFGGFNDSTDDEDGNDGIPEVTRWFDTERLQALYTLVRKSPSLSPVTRQGLVNAMADACHKLAALLDDTNNHNSDEAEHTVTHSTVPVNAHDAMAGHLYLSYAWIFHEITNRQNDCSSNTTSNASNNNTLLETCVNGVLRLSQSMLRNRARVWSRGIPDSQAVVLLPCRLAYLLLEATKGVVARRHMCGDQALEMLRTTLQYDDNSSNNINTSDSSNTNNATDDNSWCRTSISAALMDFLHSHEHAAPLVAELCGDYSSKDSNNNSAACCRALAVDLLREVGRLDNISNHQQAAAAASGIKFVAPFVSELARRQPRLVLSQLVHLEPHWSRDAYPMRSALVTSLGSILEYLAISASPPQQPDSDDDEAATPLDIPKTRTQLLDRILERLHDVSSFTRATVLKALAKLVQGNALPKLYYVKVTHGAMNRLVDKTVLVRKQAMQLLTTLLEHNPFLGNLDPAPYKAKLEELHAHVMDNLPDNIQQAHAAAMELQDQQQQADGVDDTDEVERNKQEIQAATFQAALAEVETWDSDALSAEQQSFANKVQALEFTQAALEFIHVFDSNPALEGMLLSANTSDVTQALRFFVQANHFSLPCAVTGVKRSLALMWSNEQAIRDQVLKAFCDVFLYDCAEDRLLPDHTIAQNLLVLVGQASVSESASIEEAITRLVADEAIPADVFLILWSIASKAGSPDARAAAVTVLAMGARADRGLVDSKSRIRLLLESALVPPSSSSDGDENTSTTTNWRLVGATAVALQRCQRAKIDHTDAKYLVMERVMEELCAVARGDWCNDEDDDNDTLQWFSAAEETIKALFCICPEPELACNEIIRGMYVTTFGSNSGSDTDDNQCHSMRLARFFHVLGQIALELLVYTESLSGSVRRASANKSLKKQEQADQAKAQSITSKTKDIKNGDDSNAADDEGNAIEAELGIAAEAEAENERNMADISEQEILNRGLISMFAPLLVRIVGSGGDNTIEQTSGGSRGPSILMQACTLALCKFMCVSCSFCEKHLPLLFTALQNAPEEDTTMRANMVVALGDLAFRFPNEVEPYTHRLYACLRDTSTKVRRHTLMVLTHLILNDMVKVKGQVCEIALCLRDDDPRIRDMSRLLFHELSKRSNNPIYNLLPDIISQLSQLPTARKEDFRGIMSFLLGYIKKERQNEQLVDKLCHRFPKCESLSQKADLSYCLAQLKLNERSVKTLFDKVKLYKDALHDDDVKKSFLGMLTKAKKCMSGKNGSGSSNSMNNEQVLQEWEQKIQESAALGAENEQADRKAAKAQKRATNRRRRQNRGAPLQAVEENA